MKAGRRALRLWHRWFGLAAGVWLLLLALTGSAITYYEELDHALNGDLRQVARTGPPVPAPITTALTRAEALFPGFQPRHIDLPDRPNETIWLIGSATIEGQRAGVQVFAHPQSGELVGWRQSGVWSLDRRHLPDLLYGLHVDLLVAPWVTAVFGFISLLWLIDHLLALALAVPKLALWREAFWVNGRPGSLRRLFDWHRAPGLWAWPVTFALALTGVTLAWPELSREAVRPFAAVSDRLEYSLPDRTIEARLTIDQAISKVAPLAEIDSLRPLPDKGVYAIRTHDHRDLDYQGRLWTYVDMETGEIIGRRHDVGEGPGDAFFAWQYPLHSGQALGEIGRALVFIGGLVTAALSVTGLMLWLRRGRPLGR